MQNNNTSKFSNILSKSKRELVNALIPIINNFNLRMCDIFTQFILVTGVTGIASVGIIFAIPYLYSNYSDNVILCLRLFGFFIVFQLTVNWLCIKYVDTSYKPSRDGIMPEGTSIGQIISHTFNNNHSDSAIRSRKDASSHTMELDDDEEEASLMFVASNVPRSHTEPPERTPYPYFSWVPCIRCNRPRPPRCHHCPVCDKWVLKGDHHCYFIRGLYWR